MKNIIGFILFSISISCNSFQLKKEKREIIDDLNFIIIKNEIGENKCIIVDKKRDLNKLISSLTLRKHEAIPCGYEFIIELHCKTLPNYEICINQECNYFTTDIPIFLKSQEKRGNFFNYSSSMKSIYNEYFNRINEFGLYCYKFTAPSYTNFDSLKNLINKNEKYIIHIFHKDPLIRNSYLKMSYIDSLKNFPGSGLDKIMKETEIGKIKADNIFIPTINYLKGRSVYLGCSKVRFKMGSNDYFVREIKLYVSSKINEVLIDSLKIKWNTCDFYFVNNEGYDFNVLTQSIIGENDKINFIKKYNLLEAY